jgi:tRNA-dihydrouridine synthase 4
MVAPMVRYSKLPFRLLCRQYGADVAFTPMIIAAGFNRSSLARESEFSTNAQDQPLVVQFGTDSAAELVEAVQLCLPYVQGVDINCGCPQRWAMQSGYGAALLSQPQLVSEMVSAVRAVTSLPLSIKIRLQDDLRQTVELLHRAEHAGASFITVHGRTPLQRRQPVNSAAIALVKSAASIPVIANGDVHSLAALTAMHSSTRVDGFMSARGVLSNPALFSSQSLPLSVLPDYLRLAEQYGGRYSLHHHHLQFMLAGRVSRAERMQFGSIRSLAGIRDFMQERGWMESAEEEKLQAQKGGTAAATATEGGGKQSDEYREDSEHAQRSRADHKR